VDIAIERGLPWVDIGGGYELLNPYSTEHFTKLWVSGAEKYFAKRLASGWIREIDE
jgi:hypothetical protein